MMEIRDLERMAGITGKGDAEPVCMTCGYDLRGSVTQVCPECGQAFDRLAWEREVAQTQDKLAEIENSLEMVGLGWRVGLVGLCVSVLLMLSGQHGLCVGRCISVGAGFISFFLGCGYFRAYQLPKWAREKIATNSFTTSAWAAVLLGVLLLLAGAFGLPG